MARRLGNEVGFGSDRDRSRVGLFLYRQQRSDSAHGVSGGPDISHRDGLPGFVRIDDPRTLTSPDFIGNFMFNTLGNLEFKRRVGLLFVDFAAGDTLQVLAEAEVIWDGEAVHAFAGAQRLVRFHLSEVLRVPGTVPARFSEPEYSPFLLTTGIWADAEAQGA